MKARIVKEKQLYKGFRDLREIDVEAPSLAQPGEYAPAMNREVVLFDDGASLLVYIKPLDGFLMTEQFRVGPFMNNEENPFVLGLIAGMIDKAPTPEDTLRAELYEEAGIDGANLTFEKIAATYPSSGAASEKNYTYYTEIDFEPDAGIYGLPEEGEEIRTHVIPRQKAYEMLDSFEIISMPTCLALNWFRAVKEPHLA